MGAAKLNIATTTAGSSHERRPEPVLPGTVVNVARVCVSELTSGVLGAWGEWIGAYVAQCQNPVNSS